MPQVMTPLAPGRLGFLLPPMPATAVRGTAGATIGTTTSPTFGSTQWVTALAGAAERAGAAGVWASDHLFWRQPTAECLTSLAVAAGATRHAAIGSCVLQLPLRAAAAVAKQAAALQALSDGRFVLGVGIGSHPGEYELAGVPFSSRGKALDAGIGAVRAAWRTAQTPEAGYRLAPASPVPVWIGGSSPAALRRAAACGDGWVPLFVPPDRYAASLGQLRDETARSGRDPGDVMPAVVIAATVGDDVDDARAAGTSWLATLYGIPPKAFERHLVAGTAEHCASVAGLYAEAGAAHVIVMVAADDAIGQFCELAAAYSRLGLGTSRQHDMAGVPA